MNFLRILPERRLQAEAVLLRQRRQNRSAEALRVTGGLESRSRDSPLPDGQRRLGNHQPLVKFHLIAQSEAVRAGAEGIIEGKTSRLNLFDADAAVRAGEVLAHGDGLFAADIDDHQTICQLHHSLDGIREPLLDAFLHHQAVHHDLNVVLEILVKFDLFRQIVEIPVHPDSHVTALLGLVQHLLMHALPSPDDGRQQLNLCPLRHGHDLVCHLIHRLPSDLSAALRAVGNADSRVEESQVIVYLRHRSHGRSGVPVGRLLVDGYGRRQSLNALHIRLFHLPQELSRIGGQGLHVPPLALRIDGIEGQG